MSNFTVMITKAKEDAQVYPDLPFNITFGLSELEGLQFIGMILHLRGDNELQIELLELPESPLQGRIVLRYSEVRPMGHVILDSYTSKVGFRYSLFSHPGGEFDEWSLIVGMVTTYARVHPELCTAQVLGWLSNI